MKRNDKEKIPSREAKKDCWKGWVKTKTEKAKNDDWEIVSLDVLLYVVGGGGFAPPTPLFKLSLFFSFFEVVPLRAPPQITPPNIVFASAGRPGFLAFVVGFCKPTQKHNPKLKHQKQTHKRGMVRTLKKRDTAKIKYVRERRASKQNKNMWKRKKGKRGNKREREKEERKEVRREKREKWEKLEKIGNNN